MPNYSRWQRTITNATGNVLPNATITVRHSFGPNAGQIVTPLYADAEGNAQKSGNPFNADADGFAFFYPPAAGFYDITASVPGFSITWPEVPIGTAAGHDAPAGGIGSVQSVAAAGGIETASGAPISVSGALRAARTPQQVAGTSYAFADADRGRIKIFDDANPIAASIPAAGSGDPAQFVSGWFSIALNRGAGAFTLTPDSGTINGQATLSLPTGSSAIIVSDGANYFAIVMHGAAAISALAAMVLEGLVGAVAYLNIGVALVDAEGFLTIDLADLTEEASPGSSDLFLMQRASDGGLRKVAGANLPGSGGESEGGGAFPPAGFYAHKNGTNQTGIVASTQTKITWEAVRYNDGGYFDVATGRFQPPPGKYLIRAVYNVTNLADQNKAYPIIKRNSGPSSNSDWHTEAQDPRRMSGSTDTMAVSVSVIAKVIAAEFFESWFFWDPAGGSSANRTIDGTHFATYFEAVRLEAYDGIGGNDEFCRMLLQFGNGIYTVQQFADHSRYAGTITANGNAVLDPTRFEFEFGQEEGKGASAQFDGTGDYLDRPDFVDGRIGTDDFAVDFKVWFDVGSRFHSVLAKGSAANLANGGLLFQFSDHASAPALSVYLDSGSATLTETGGAPIGEWVRYSVRRHDGELKIIREGVETGSVANSSDVDGTGTWYIGGSPDFDGLDGNLEYLRLSVGDGRADEPMPDQHYTTPEAA